MDRIMDVIKSFKVIHKWDWNYATQEILAGLGFITIEMLFCWMIASNLQEGKMKIYEKED